MQDFRKLRVWNESHRLTLDVHRVARGIRGSMHFSLRSQMVRAAMSIPANIVEGRAQESDAQFARFLKIAVASAAELEYHVVVAADLKAIGTTDSQLLLEQLAEVRKMLIGLLRSVGRESPPAHE